MFPLNAMHMFIGSSKSGKSYLLKFGLTQLLEEKKHGLKFGMVFTATKHTGAYDWLPDHAVHNNFNLVVLKNYVAWLQKTSKKKNKPIPNSFVVFDDIVNSLPKNDAWFNEFLSGYRHYNITIFVTTQYINRCAPLFREQASFAYIFQLHTKAAIEAAYDSYGASFETVKAWKKFLAEATDVEHQALVWAKEAKLIIAEKYSKFKAPVVKVQKKFDF